MFYRLFHWSGWMKTCPKQPLGIHLNTLFGSAKFLPLLDCHSSAGIKIWLNKLGIYQLKYSGKQSRQIRRLTPIRLQATASLGFQYRLDSKLLSPKSDKQNLIPPISFCFIIPDFILLLVVCLKRTKQLNADCVFGIFLFKLQTIKHWNVRK